MKKLLFICFFCFLAINSFSQNEKIDSVLVLLESTQIDTVKVKALIKLCWLYRTLDAPKAIDYGVQAYELAIEIDFLKGASKASNNLGVAYRDRGELKLAKENHLRSLEIDEKLNDLDGMASSYNNLSIMADDAGDFDKAIGYVIKSIELYTKNGNNKGLGSSYNTLGSIYISQENYDKAEEYYLLAKKIYIKTNNEAAEATSLMNLGIVYFYKGMPDTTMLYFQRTYEVYKRIDHKIGQSNILGNIAQLYLGDGKNQEALDYYHKAVIIITEVGDKGRLANLYLSIAAVYSKGYKNNSKSLEYLFMALNAAKESGGKNNIRKVYASLSNTYENIGNYKKAYAFKELYIIMNDSIFNEKKLKQIGELEAKYKNEKITLENKNLEIETALKTEELENEKTQKYALYGGLGLVLILAFVLFTGMQRKKKDNVLILAQKKEVENQKFEIEHQHDVLEEQHQEITDSINYAKRIQSALLTEDVEWDKISKEHFIVFIPKNVVSGDFFWAFHDSVKNLSVWVAADCTGHGVPGAFMSMLGIGFLNEIIVENNITRTAEILNQLRAKIINALQQKNVDTQQKDGMDLAICVWDKSKNVLEFSGANNPLWLLREVEHLSEAEKTDPKILFNDDKSKAIVEYKGDKMPVGIYSEEIRPFNSIKIELKKGDTIFTFSDGYPDQFGGEKGKKLKYKPFKEMLLSNSDKSLPEQKKILNTHFEQWRGDLEQIDDVCIIGVRI